jgi:CubicO group peptidase (beta-lactamase class C family)
MTIACGGAGVATTTPPVQVPPPAPPARRDPAAELAPRIDPIFASYASGRTPGCAVGVYRAGEPLFARGYGYADLEHDVPLTDASVFYLASVSKQFTAAAVLLLAGEGKLSIDDDVRKFIPELPDYGKRMTLRHLLHHTSGVRDYELLLELEGRETDRLTNADMLWLLAHQRALNFPPGSAFAYSNSGYVLLSIVVERVSGMAFSAFMKERVFDPLGMEASSVAQDHGRLVPGRAVGYAMRPDGTLRISMNSRDYTGPGNVMTTIRDLARWDANFYTPRVGGQALVDGLRTRDTLEDGKPSTYAMGLGIGESLGRPFETHAGGAWGYRTVLVRYPGERLAVAVLCNDASARPSELAEQVAKVFLPATETAPPQSAPAITAAAPSPVAAGTYEVKPAELARCAGRYGSDELTRDVQIVVDGGKLFLGPWGSTPGAEPLEPVGRDAFRRGHLGITFERTAQGRIEAVVFDTESTRHVRLQRR